MNPVSIDGKSCVFPGPDAPRCPGYTPAAAVPTPDHLKYLPLFSMHSGEQPGCAHLQTVPTARGGFRGACGHPGGNPVRWARDLVGRRVDLGRQREAMAQ